MGNQKPTHVKPAFYAACYQATKEKARELGYNLLLHGSTNRDFDLVAVPWVDNPAPEIELIHAMSEILTGGKAPEGLEKQIYMHTILPGGRSSYVINIHRKGIPDPQYYLDISVTPMPQPNGN